MNSKLEQLIHSIPADEFQDSGDNFTELSPIERIRWIQQTAWFIWKYKGAAQRGEESSPGTGS